MACKKEVEIKEGPYKVRMESVEYEPAWSLGANCGNDDIASVAFMIDRANDWGYDAIEIGQALSALMEATEREFVVAGEGPAEPRQIDVVQRASCSRRGALETWEGERVAEQAPTAAAAREQRGMRGARVEHPQRRGRVRHVPARRAGAEAEHARAIRCRQQP